jgi:transposase-like protein
MTNEPQTLLEAIRHFADPDVCLEFVTKFRWPDGVVTCPNCGRQDAVFIESRKIWQCRSKHPKRQFSVKVGTIFEDSPIGLDKWLAAMWMIANDKNGVSSYEMHRALGVTQKTAWFMLHRIRLVMKDDGDDKMDGPVEVDETYVGGKAEFMHKTRRDRVFGTEKRGTGTMGKTAVFGLLERHGPDGHSRVRAKVMKGTRTGDLIPEVRKNVHRGGEVYSDAYRSYILLREEYVHEVVDHAVEYVNGKVHTNGLENFWSLLKRAIRGTYVAVEPFHLDRYIDEQAFRYNNRHNVDGGRFQRVVGGIVGKRLTYADLIGKPTTPA